jgi:hypothetical protein
MWRETCGLVPGEQLAERTSRTESASTGKGRPTFSPRKRRRAMGWSPKAGSRSEHDDYGEEPDGRYPQRLRRR